MSVRDSFFHYGDGVRRHTLRSTGRVQRGSRIHGRFTDSKVLYATCVSAYSRKEELGDWGFSGSSLEDAGEYRSIYEPTISIDLT